MSVRAKNKQRQFLKEFGGAAGFEPRIEVLQTYAARWSACSQLVSRFHLVKIWATILRSRLPARRRLPTIARLVHRSRGAAKVEARRWADRRAKTARAESTGTQSPSTAGRIAATVAPGRRRSSAESPQRMISPHARFRRHIAKHRVGCADRLLASACSLPECREHRSTRGLLCRSLSIHFFSSLLRASDQFSRARELM